VFYVLSESLFFLMLSLLMLFFVVVAFCLSFISFDMLAVCDVGMFVEDYGICLSILY